MKNSKIAIINARIFYKNRFKKGFILIKDNKIKKVSFKNYSSKKLKDYRVIDAEGGLVSYGFIDPHVHFRTPGHEHKETWETGSRAAVKGGFTYVLDMPNNDPAPVSVKTMINKAAKTTDSIVNFGFHVGLTDKNAGKIKKIYTSLRKKNIPVFGVKAFLGSSTGNLLINKDKSVQQSLKSSLITLFHCEDEAVLKNYEHIPYKTIADHEKRRPVDAAVSALKKIIAAAKPIKKQARIYICHVSGKKEVELIKKYRKKGYKIIAEVTPHHLFFDLGTIDDSPFYKVNPPIRSTKDVVYIRKMFNKGFFDVVGTDHAPHLKAEKESDNPPSGMPGLESAFYALYKLYEQGILSLEMIFKSMTAGYKIFGIKKRGKIKKNYYADLTIIKREPHTFKASDTVTKADFSPFDGLKTTAKIDTVILNGKVLTD